MTLSDDTVAGTVDFAEPATSARPGGFAARLFGYDIFISFALGPPPRGSQAYASDLARRLREQDMSVFYSEDEAAPGAELDDTLVSALHRSRILVVLCNHGTLAEPRWVKEEVLQFRAKHPERPIIPINIGGALLDPELNADTQDWLQFRDKIWIDESAEAGQTGQVSAEVLQRLVVAPRQTRTNQWWRRIVAGTGVVLATLTVVAGFFAWFANERDQSARLELTKATAQRLASQAVPMMKGEQPGGPERAVLQVLAAAALDQPSHVLDQALHALNVRLQNTVKLVDLGTTIQSLAFSPDDRKLVMGGIGRPRGDRLEFFDAETLQRIETPISRFEQTEGAAGISVHAAAFNPQDPNQVAWTGVPPDRRHEDGWTQDLMIWDLAKDQELSQRQSFVGTVGGLEYSPDGRFIAILRNGLQIIDTATGKPVADPVDTGNDAATDVVYSPDGMSVLTTGLLQTWIWPFDPDTGALAEPISLDFRPQRFKATFSPDGAQVATGDGTGIITFWDAVTGQELTRHPEGAEWDRARRHQAITAINYLPGTPFMLTADADGKLLVRAPGGQVLLDLDVGETRAFGALAPSHDGARIAVGGDSGILRIMKLPRAFLIDPKGGLYILDTADRMGTYRMDKDERAAINAMVKTLRYRRALHRTETNPSEYIKDADGSPEDVTAVAYSFNAGFIATGAKNGTVRVGPADTLMIGGISSETDQNDWFMIDTGEPATAEDLALANAEAARDDPNFDYEAVDWAGSRLFTVSNAPVRRLAVSDDGTYVLVDAGDGIELWNARNGQLIGDTPKTFPIDGWIGPADWVPALCGRVTRNMTRAEWAEWVSPEIEYRIQCPDLPAE